ncbi:urease accessory protein UreD [Marivibrio halodurans]|uniref:Urease accessory protein UreD n=1 Tax=Marivibrio halodurans TaxID=2039722 RepID=A0A8J7S1A7_9PROT|nr:urease accessory protein UreD [Marivibrio halodurans]MBP5858425.1 urease accessory protein UreD [Marivibrio halodurans]
MTALRRPSPARDDAPKAEAGGDKGVDSEETGQYGLPGGPRRVAAALLFRRAGHQPGARTFLARQHTPHPFHMTRPFHFPDDPPGMATLYLQSSSGGLYGDDDLTLDIWAEAGAAAQITTQASTIVHAARGGVTRQTVRLRADSGALLEYLPDPVILFPGADIAARVEARVAPGAVAMLSDSFLAHDPDGADARFLRFENAIVIHRGAVVEDGWAEDGAAAPTLVDRMRLAGACWPGRGTAVQDFRCHGAFFLVNPPDGARAVEAMRAALLAVEQSGTDSGGTGGESRAYSAVEHMPGRGIVAARFLTRDGALLSRMLNEVAAAARLAVTGWPPARRPK